MKSEFEKSKNIEYTQIKLRIMFAINDKNIKQIDVLCDELL